MAERVRHQLFLGKPLSDRLEALAAAPGVTKSALLAEALDRMLKLQGASEIDDRFGPRLDTLSRSLGRIERDLHILLESLALFIRYELSVRPPLAEDDAAGRAQARRRFEAFITQVGRSIAGGKRTLDAGSDSQP